MTATDTRDLRIALEKWARGYEPRLLDGRSAQRQLHDVARMEAICASVKARLARRVEETNQWRRGGHKSAAHAVASATGTSIGAASKTLKTAERLEELPETAEAFTVARRRHRRPRSVGRFPVTEPLLPR
jgi:hypothetical protein